LVDTASVNRWLIIGFQGELMSFCYCLLNNHVLCMGILTWPPSEGGSAVGCSRIEDCAWKV
jgi:hypothetical protein